MYMKEFYVYKHCPISPAVVVPYCGRAETTASHHQPQQPGSGAGFCRLLQRTEAAAKRQPDSLYSQLQQLRANLMPPDEVGLAADTASSRAAAWQRPNAFGETD
jgi:hypothetical protein